MNQYQILDCAGFDSGLAGVGAILIDVRTDAEVARGKIHGALHIPLNMLPVRLSELDKKQPLVFCCQMGGRSAQACQFAVAQGFSKVYNLQGGMSAWLAAGKPTTVTI
ncbi:MAG: rhodanese-like domain-containing protein [Burkholderiales bacterium]